MPYQPSKPTSPAPCPQATVKALLEDVGALCAPGSKLVCDVLDQHALEGACCPPGFANLAAAVANKGSPFLSGIMPQFSGGE